jgi:hypothetical protein
MKTVKTLIAVTVLGLGSAPAFADVPAPIGGNGGLVFIGYDSVAGTSLLQYLNLDLDDSQPGNLAANLPAGGDVTLTGYSAAFGSSVAANIRWMVVAGDVDGFGGGPNYTGAQYDSLFLASTSLTNPASQNNAGLEGGLFNLDEFIGTRVNNVNGCSGNSPCVATSALQPQYAGLLSTQLNGLVGGAPALSFNTTGGVTDTLGFYLLAGTGDQAGGQVLKTVYAGAWSLAGNILHFASAAPPVPLPAAAWLLLSGLIGMFTVGRRRNTTAAA